MALLELSWLVSATVLAKVDLELSVVLLASDRLDSLDGVGNVGEVDKGAALLAEGVNQLNLTKLGEILSQALLGPGVIKVANVHVSRSTTADGQSDSRRQRARVLSPANLEAAVVDHETLNVTQSVERSGCRGIDKGNEANVLVRDVTDVVQESTSYNIANLLNGGLGVDVTKVDGSVAQVVDTTGRSSNRCCGNRLLSQGTRNDLAICASEHVSISGVDTEVLRGVLLLRLGDVSASVLAVVDSARRLPLGLLGQLLNGLHGVSNRQEVDKGNVLLPDDLDRVNGTELSKILAQLLVANLFGEVTQIDISRGARLLNSQSDRGRDLGGLAPANLDVLALDAELFQDGIRVEVGGSIGIEERDEGAVLVGEKADRLNLAATDVTQNLLGRRVRRNVSKVDGSARSSDHGSRAHLNRRGGLHLHLTSHVVEAASGRLRSEELGCAVGRGRDNGLILLRRHVSLHRATHTIVLLLLAGMLVALLVPIEVLELVVGKSGSARLERATEEQLRRKQRRELHVKASAGSGHVLSIGRSRGLLVHRLSINRGNVASARVSIGKTRNVGSKGAVGETGIAVGRLGGVTEAVTTLGRPSRDPRDRKVLHPEQMRRDKAVPRYVR